MRPNRLAKPVSRVIRGMGHFEGIVPHNFQTEISKIGIGRPALTNQWKAPLILQQERHFPGCFTIKIGKGIILT